MPKAIWNGTVLADSKATVEVEGNQYFPPESVNRQYLKPTEKHTECGWKGTASYFSVEVDGEMNENAAWYYPDPKPEASNIKDHVAFWNGVEIEPN